MINWEKQWELFAPHFQNGLAHIPLLNKTVLRLLPGPGFGDLSHPTTRLMLTLLQARVQDKTVWDIGCGSGILGLAALLCGAKKAYGIDIDPLALAHAHKNAIINDLEKIEFSLSLPSSKPDIILLNMIYSEQQIAWDPTFLPSQVIASGILKDHQDKYLQLTSSWGWKLSHAAEEDNWLAFIFLN